MILLFPEKERIQSEEGVSHHGIPLLLVTNHWEPTKTLPPQGTLGLGLHSTHGKQWKEAAPHVMDSEGKWRVLGRESRPRPTLTAAQGGP